MSAGVMMAVLCGALLHAGWNALVKSGRDTLLDIVLVTLGMGLIGAAVLPWLGLPAVASWPHVVASALIHVAYFLLVAGAYHRGDMSYAYPLMRGSAPLLVALFSGGLVGERMAPGTWAGVLLICGGVLWLALLYRPAEHPAAAPTAFALSNAAVIAAYTCVDGLGVRLSGSPAAYTLCVFILDGPALLLWALWRRPAAQVLAHLGARWPLGLAGGAATLTSYGLSLWAMTRAPIAAVAALRETAILFGMGLAALVLKERFGAMRYAAAATIAAGAVALRLA